MEERLQQVIDRIAKSYRELPQLQHVQCERCGSYAPGTMIDTIAERAWCYDCQRAYI